MRVEETSSVETVLFDAMSNTDILTSCIAFTRTKPLLSTDHFLQDTKRKKKKKVCIGDAASGKLRAQTRVSLEPQSLPFPMPQSGMEVILELGESETNVKYEAASVHLQSLLPF